MSKPSAKAALRGRSARLIPGAVAACAVAVLAPSAHAAVPMNVSFQPAGAPVPAGYVADTGAAYSAAHGSGWVRQDSLTAATHVGLDVSGRTRDRNAVADQRLDTLVLLQTAPGGATVPAAAWELAVPDGDYTVKVAAGDPSYLDSTHRVRVEGSVAIGGFTPSGGTRSAAATVTVRVTDGRLSVDASGGSNTKLQYLEVAAATVTPPTPPVDAPPKVNFQPAGAAVPSGYAADTGLPFAAGRGYGWVRQDSLGAATRVGLDVTGRTRDRNATADQRQDTFASLQAAPGTTAVAAAWEANVPNGTYTVTVGAGDASYLDSTHRVNVEGTAAITGFTPTAATRFRVATVTVTVADGRLTLDAAGGSNTKLDYVDIAPGSTGPVDPPVDPPTPPTGGATGTWPATSAWTTRTSTPVTRFESVGTAMGGKLYAFGGFSDGGLHVNGTYGTYDPATDTWATLGNLPAGMAETHLALAHDDRFVYFAGGFGGDYHRDEQPPQWVSDQVWRYEPATDAWTLLGRLPQPRGAGGLAVVGRTLHYLSGNPADRLTNVADHFTFDMNTGTWGTAAAVPDPKDHFSVITVAGLVYLLGGEHGHDRDHAQRATAHAYDPATDTWRRLADIPLAKSHIESGTFLLHGRIVMAGGQRQDYLASNEVDAYDIATNRWTRLAPLPGPRQGALVQPIGNRMVLALGADIVDQPRGDVLIGSL